MTNYDTNIEKIKTLIAKSTYKSLIEAVELARVTFPNAESDFLLMEAQIRHYQDEDIKGILDNRTTRWNKILSAFLNLVDFHTQIGAEKLELIKLSLTKKIEQLEVEHKNNENIKMSKPYFNRKNILLIFVSLATLLIISSIIKYNYTKRNNCHFFLSLSDKTIIEGALVSIKKTGKTIDSTTNSKGEIIFKGEVLDYIKGKPKISIKFCNYLFVKDSVLEINKDSVFFILNEKLIKNALNKKTLALNKELANKLNQWQSKPSHSEAERLIFDEKIAEIKILKKYLRIDDSVFNRNSLPFFKLIERHQLTDSVLKSHEYTNNNI